MIELTVNEIKRYIKLKGLIDSDSDDYSRDMEDLIEFLNDNLRALPSYKVKRTLYFSKSINSIKYKYTFSSGGTSKTKGYIITMDYSIAEYMLSRFLLSYESIDNILIHWIKKYNKIEIERISFSKGFERNCFLELNK